MGATVIVTTDEMRAKLPAFADSTKYTDDTLQNVLVLAQNYVSPLNIGGLRGETRAYAIYLMAGHVQAINDKIAAGGGKGFAGILTSASIGSVSVSAAPPPIKSQFDYWLNQTPYGQQLLFLLSSFAAVGLYVGGSNENVFR